MRSLAASVLAELDRRGETLASAESLTGGMVGQLLTDVPGASASYLGGVISYATRLKTTLAGVDATTLAELWRLTCASDSTRLFIRPAVVSAKRRTSMPPPFSLVWLRMRDTAASAL